MSDYTDSVLREFWHATARAPREYPGDHSIYGAGLDALGAGLPRGRQMTQTTRQKTGKKPGILARTFGKMTAAKPAAKTATMSAAMQKAKQVAATSSHPALAKAVAAKIPGAVGKSKTSGKRAVTSGQKLLAVAKKRKDKKAIAAAQKAIDSGNKALDASKKLTKLAATHLHGDGPLTFMATGVEAELQGIRDAMNYAWDTANNADQDADVADELFNQYLSEHPTTPTDGTTVPGGSGTVPAGGAVTTTPAGTPVPSPPPGDSGLSTGGGYGGGGGGGGFDSGGGGGGDSGGGDAGGGLDESMMPDAGGEYAAPADESMPMADEMTARFRESGGAWDPFADQGAPEEGAPSDEGVSDEDQAAADQAEADQAAADQEAMADEAAAEQVDALSGEDENLLSDADDIFYDRHEIQITDQPPDVERRRASSHRGIAYLQDVTFPPHGSSAGQEGGIMQPEETLTIFGAAYSRGVDVLGAGHPVSKKKKVGKKASKGAAAAGGKVTSGSPASPPKSTKKHLLDRAQSRLKKVQKVTEKAAKTAIAKAKSFKPGKPVTVHGMSVLGIVFGALTGDPKAKLRSAQKRYNDALVKNAAAAAKTEKRGKAALEASKNAKKMMVKQQTNLLRLKKGQSVIAGDSMEEILGAAAEAVADVIFGSDPDPNNPGYLMDGSPDPAYADSTSADAGAPADASTFDAAAFTPGAPTPGEGNPSILWPTVPADGVVRDPSLGWPRYSKGSVSYYDPSRQNDNGGMFGMVWGYDHMNWPNSGDPIRWIERKGQDSVGNDVWGDDHSGGSLWDESYAVSRSTGNAYGPLIGAPASYTVKNSTLDPNIAAGYFAGLRYTKDGKWFWPWSLAPDSAKQPILQQAADAAKVAQDAAQKASDAHQAVLDQIRQEGEVQDAKNALVQAQAEADAAAAGVTRESKQADVEQQQAAQQAQIDLDEQAAQAQMDLAEAKALAAAPPEEDAAPEEAAPEEAAPEEAAPEETAPEDQSDQAAVDAESVMGMLRGVDRLRLRRHLRR